NAAGGTARAAQRRGDGGGCTLSLSCSATAFDYLGGTETGTVSASSMYCSWSAKTDVSWIDLQNASGEGPGSFTFSVDPYFVTDPLNPFDICTPRTGTITVGGDSVTIVQFSIYGVICLFLGIDDAAECCTVKAASLL